MIDDISLEFTPNESLYRRIPAEWYKPDGSISSQAFTHEEMSVDRAKIRLKPEECLEQYPTMGLASVSVGLATSLEQKVVPDPKLLNRAHTLVVGKKTKSIQKAFAREAKPLIPPNVNELSQNAQPKTS